MRIIALLAFLVPLLTFTQVKYSTESKKLYSKAIKEYKDGNSEEALNLFQECVKLEPRYAEAYLNISYILYADKEMEGALTNAQLAYHNNKLQSAIYDQLGKCYYKNEMYDSAAFFLKQGVDMGQSSEATFIFAGKSNYQIEEYESAIEFLNKALELNDKNPVTYNSRGKVYFRMAEYDQAELDFKKALEINPNSVGIYSNLANTLLDNGKTDEALEYINLGMDKAENEEKVQLLLLLGNYYHSAGDFEKATETFDQAHELDDSNAHILNNQAAVLLDQDKFEEAIAKLDAAIDLQPEMMEAYFNRGIAYEMLRRVEEACSDWEEAFILGSEKAEEYLNSPTCNE
ncbi:MAG: tetratricopeptide repeat protein [Crocinitomicaceae bacterium]|nr:tetratricopeptide repeat protein [Crocinitomicaceae bacterium]